MNKLEKALNDPIWQDHKIVDTYTMDGKPELWKISYYPLFGTYNNKTTKDLEIIEVRWIYFESPRALIEKPITGGTDFREMPLHYLTKTK